MTASAERTAEAQTDAVPRSRRLTRPRWLTNGHLVVVRWLAIAVWLGLFISECVVRGIPFDRESVLLWIATGAMAISIGKRSVAFVLLDFLPFAVVLAAWDYLRGAADTLGMPAWWHPQVDIDRFLGLGSEPTLWLQEHLRQPSVQWYDVLVSFVYCSFFVVPYLTAGVLWLRSRTEFWRWVLRYSAMAMLAYAVFALLPTAPPWAASRCTAADVAGHPTDPLCMTSHHGFVPHNLLGPYSGYQPGTSHHLTRIVWRGFDSLHIALAHHLWTKGLAIADRIAAVPSLHFGSAMLVAVFFWSRVRWWLRPLLAAYPVAMAFSLVYSGEHYVTDCLAAAVLALGVHLVGNWIERRRKERRRLDTLDAPPVDLEKSCPPSHPLRATTPSST
jgi:hypothetical protein